MGTPALTVSQAGEKLRGMAPVRRSERVPLDLCLGRTLTREVLADRDLPPYDRVCVDGYALRSIDWDNGLREYRVCGAALAGAPRHEAPPEGSCLEVMTGSVRPEGCDRIVRLEDAMWAGEGRILFEKSKLGTDIHLQGQDVRKGAPVLQAMTRLGAAEIAVLASVGCAVPEVLMHPRVAILATGDELVGLHDQPEAHQIRRSNDRFVSACLGGMGFPAPTRIHVSDNLEEIVQAITTLLANHQVLILSGGVSVSRRDFVPKALELAGVTQIFHKVAQRPGKPLWTGAGPEGQFVAALPGNPVAAAICFSRYVKPVLRRSLGLTDETHTVRISFPVAAHFEMTRFVAVRLRDDGAGARIAHPFEGNGSGDFLHLAGTDGFVEIPPQRGTLQPDAILRFHPW
jgi:molybdopterin molybdotransferase